MNPTEMASLYLRFWSCGWCWQRASHCDHWQIDCRAPSCTQGAPRGCFQGAGVEDPGPICWKSSGTAPSGSPVRSACSFCRPAPAPMDPQVLHLLFPEQADPPGQRFESGCHTGAAGAAGWRTARTKSWSCRWFPVERPKCSPWGKKMPLSAFLKVTPATL